MNICVTGALGHIGSQLIRDLNIPNVDVIHLVDNLMTQRYASLFNLPQDKKYVFHQIDVLSDELEEIMKDSDIVIHLAAITDAETSFSKPDLIEKNNKEAVKKIAELCAKHNVALMFPSSTSVYGSQSEVVDENCTDEELQPQSPYAESKRYAEKLLQQMAQEQGLKVVIFRLGTIFGYSIGMRFHTAVNKFIYQSVNGQPISVWKTALHQKRPYCDLSDAVAAFNYFASHQIFDGEIYNIVTENYTVNDIIEGIKKYVPEIKIDFVDSKIMNQLSYNVENKKSLTKGIQYSGNLDRSLKETISKLQGTNYTIQKTNL